MAIQPSHVRDQWSTVRGEKVEVGRLYDDGFLYLKGDPGVWIQSNPHSLSSVRSLELYRFWYKGERIGDSIGELSQLTHLSIYGGFCNLKCLPNTLSRLHNLLHLELYACQKLEDLPPNLGDLYNLTYLSLNPCYSLKLIESVAKLSNLTTLVISQLEELPLNLGGLYNLKSLTLDDCENYVIESVTKLSNLTTLTICDDGKLQELPANLGDLKFLASLFLDCDRLRCLPWSITKLSNLRILYLPEQFRLETLPPHLNDSIIISVAKTHIRKTWKELKTHMTETLSYQFPIIPEQEEMVALQTSNPGYLHFTGCPTQCDLQSRIILLDSIGVLQQLTRLYISHGCLLHHLPPSFSRLTHLSLIDCTFECDTDSHFDSLRNLSTLTSLHLCPRYNNFLPEHMELPISLRHHADSINSNSTEDDTEIIAESRQEAIIEQASPHRPLDHLPVEMQILEEELAAQKTSTPGYLQFIGDPTLWIRHYNNYSLHSWLRVLDLDLGDWIYQGKIPDFIGELPQLTHLYISNGCLPHHLPPTFSRLMHLSLIKYNFERHTKSHFDSLGNLSTLTSLHLYPRYNKLLPEHMDFPISLTHLTFQCSLKSSIKASMGKLSNLNTLTLSECGDLESLPLHLNLTKLILRETTIQSLPIALKHLEIIHVICRHKLCKKLQECWRNQLVNLETLSFTCSDIKSLLSLTSLHNLRELQLKDCFNLKELPQNLDKWVKLCTLDVSGTRIQSLPNSIINLNYLRRIILPKCFRLYTLPPDFENKVMISVDDTDERYYKYKRYHDRRYEIINDCDYMTSDSIKETNEKFLEKFKQATITIIEQASPHRPSNHQPDATRTIEGSLPNGSADPTCNNNHSAFSSSLTLDEILPTRNKAAGTKPDVAAEYFSIAPMDFEAFNTDISNFPYRNNIPAVIMDNLVGWKDVEADGNCGFRCVAEVFHGGQENWPMARRAILNELKAHPDVYQQIYRDDYDSALKRIDWNDGQCGEDHYMAIVADLYPIANCYQCPVMCFTMNGLDPHLSATVFPWNVGAHSTKPTKEFTIAHLGIYNKHYILLDLKDDFPVPPILHLWYAIRNETVVDWDSPYKTRMQRWEDRLTNRSRDSIHLDVSDDCNVNGGNNPVVENISHTNFSSHIQETQILQPNNKDGVIAVETSSKLHETNLSGESSQQAFQNGGVLKQGTSSIDLRISAHGGSDNRALVKRQNKNPQGGNVKHKNQKIEIPIERKMELKSQNMTVEEGAIHIGGFVSPEGNNNAVGENSSHAVSSSQNQETENLQSKDLNGVVNSVSDIAAKPSSNLHETNLSSENNQLAFQNGGIDNINLKSEHGTLSSDSLISTRNKNPQRSNVKRSNQKIEIPLDMILELKSQNMTIEEAAKHFGGGPGASRSTLKRALLKNDISWPRKKPDKNRNTTHTTKSSCERNLSHLNSVDHSNPTSHNEGVELFAGPSRPTSSSDVPSEHNVVNNSTHDVVTTTVGEPPLSTKYCMDRHQHVEEHPIGAKEPAMVNTDLPPNEKSSTFVMKATFNKDIVRFNFSLSSGIKKLKEVLGKKLDLKVGTFKIRYQDDEKDWVLMDDLDDLELALNLSRASGSNVVRLSIESKT